MQLSNVLSNCIEADQHLLQYTNNAPTPRKQRDLSLRLSRWIFRYTATYLLPVLMIIALGFVTWCERFKNGVVSFKMALQLCMMKIGVAGPVFSSTIYLIK